MDLRKYLKENQLVQVEYLDSNGESQRYPSRVENIWEDRIAVASPVKNRVPVFIPNGNYVSVYFSDSLAVYSFRSKVIFSLPERIPLLLINAPDFISKAQKREYVRVPINSRVLLKQADTDMEFWGKSRDLSGGGMMLIFDKDVKLNKGDFVKATFHLEDDLIEVTGELVRIYHEYDAASVARQIVGLKFLDLLERERQIIIKFVYQRQIELRRKGLL